MMMKRKTFEQMLKAYKEVRRQVIDAKLEHITSVGITEYNDLTRHCHWVNIEVSIGVGGEFDVDNFGYIRINDNNFDSDMETFKATIAEYINKPNN